MRRGSGWVLGLLALSGCGGLLDPAMPLPVRDQANVKLRDLAALRDAMWDFRPPKQQAASGAPDVVIIMLDTFRADRLAAYGGDPGLAPRLNAFASQARVYTEMRSTSSWTLPSHASLFTGRYPINHGAHGSPPGAASVAYGLPFEGTTTLAHRLRRVGYSPLAVAANRAFLSQVWGLGRGFDLWLCDDIPFGAEPVYVRGDRITALGLAAHDIQAERAPDAPVLLFLNYMDTHAPWFPREGYTANPEHIDPSHLPNRQARASVGGRRWGRIRHEVLSGARPASADEIRSWTEAYNAEVRWLDEQVGDLLDGLAARGHGPDDYTIVLADHGEYLGEHGLITHSKGLHEEVIAVPLLIQGPGFAPGVDPTPVQINDVPELLLQALGMPRLSPEEDDGPLQIAELYWGRHRELDDPRLVDRFNHIDRAFVRDGRKVITTEEEGALKADYVAYDLAADPQELTSQPALPWARQLYDGAVGWLAVQEAPASHDVELSPGQLEALRALGYLE